jgi:hypothetical protein
MTPGRSTTFAAVALVLGLLAMSFAHAQTSGAAADLQLVLAVDTSGSVDQRRFELQKLGYVGAFRNPRVHDAIRSGPARAIAVTMVQWTGPTMQAVAAPWTLIRDPATANAFAAAIEDAPRQLFFGGTSISGAIDHALALMPASPFKAARQTIDISGDGSNNRGRSVNLARDEAVAAGVVINGLPILALEPDLDGYYRDNVIGGAGAFAIAAETYETFADAVLKKLIIEIASTPQSIDALAKASGTPQIPGLSMVYLHPLAAPREPTRWKHIIVHQTEGPAGSARAGAQAQAANPSRRGVMLWVETDGTVYWATPETAVPTHGDGANRNDNKYVDNSKTFRAVTADNSIGVEFAGNYPDVARPATAAQIQAWSILVRFLQERYAIAPANIYAHNWIDFKDARYCEGCALAAQARELNYRPRVGKSSASGL